MNESSENELEAPLEEASSLLLSVKIDYEKRSDRLTVIERELLASIRAWLALHPPPNGDA